MLLWMENFVIYVEWAIQHKEAVVKLIAGGRQFWGSISCVILLAVELVLTAIEHVLKIMP